MQPLLLFKILHKFHLMFMNILEAEMSPPHILSHQNTPEFPVRSDIVDRTALIKISQRDLSVFFIHPHRCDRGRNLLHQCQILFQIPLIGTIDHIF